MTLFSRRQFLRSAGITAAVPAMPRIAAAQDYPARPVRIVVAFPPGGGTDIIARLLGQWLMEHLGGQFIVENRPGAGGNIGTEAVIRAAPDGHTLLMVTAANAINATLYAHLNFDFIRDTAPIAGIMRVPNVMEVNPSVPVKSVPEFVAYAKANPGRINMASGGTGTSQHVAGELFKMMTGVDLLHVPYRGGGPALVDLLAGQAQVMFDVMPSSIAYIRAGGLRALAVTTAARSPALPDLPTVGEFVPGYEASSPYGMAAPKNTPAAIVAKLNRHVNAALTDAAFKARLADLGGTPLSGSPAAFGTLMADETEKWAKVIEFSGAKLN